MEHIVDMTITYWGKIRVLTADTIYELNTDQEEELDGVPNDEVEGDLISDYLGELDIVLEHRIREVLYRMWIDAKSKVVAAAYERKRAAYFRQLYLFSYGVRGPANQIGGKTEARALLIVDSQRGYLKKIERLNQRHSVFMELLEQLPDELRAFLMDDAATVSYEKIRAAMIENIMLIENFYKKIDRVRREKERMLLGNSEIRKYHNNHAGKKQYLINGRFMYLTLEDYELYKQLKTKQHECLMGQRMEEYSELLKSIWQLLDQVC